MCHSLPLSNELWIELGNQAVDTLRVTWEKNRHKYGFDYLGSRMKSWNKLVGFHLNSSKNISPKALIVDWAFRAQRRPYLWATIARVKLLDHRLLFVFSGSCFDFSELRSLFTHVSGDDS